MQSVMLDLKFVVIILEVHLTVLLRFNPQKKEKTKIYLFFS